MTKQLTVRVPDEVYFNIQQCAATSNCSMNDVTSWGLIQTFASSGTMTVSFSTNPTSAIEAAWPGEEPDAETV